jgi:hypothetical protein
MRKRYATTNPVFLWMVVKEYVKRRAPQLNRLSRFPQGSLTGQAGQVGEQGQKDMNLDT